MKRYFLVEVDASETAKLDGIKNSLRVRYNCTAVVEITSLHFEARDGSQIHSDTQMMDMPQQTVSGYLDK